MSSLEALMRSEITIQKKTFLKSFSYKDDNQENPTTVTVTNTEHGFTGAVAALRIRQRNFVDYDSGYVLLQSQKPRFYGQTSGDFEYVALLDLDGFLGVFGDSKALYKFLNAKTNEVLADWKACNAGKDMVGMRAPVQKIFTISSHTWTGKKNKKEHSHYDVQLNTYLFTMANMREQKPVIRAKDVKICIKLRTSNGVNEGPDHSGTIDNARYDGFGYQCTAPHFFNLLRSEGLKTLIQQAREFRASTQVVSRPAEADGRKRKADLDSPSAHESHPTFRTIESLAGEWDAFGGAAGSAPGEDVAGNGSARQSGAGSHD